MDEEKKDQGGSEAIDEQQLVLDLFNEGWNLLNTLLAIPTDSEKVLRRIHNQEERFLNRSREMLRRRGLEFLDLSGEVYTPELPVFILNLGDYATDDVLCIQRMKRPVVKVVDSAEVVQTGMAIVKKAEAILEPEKSE